MRFLQFLVQAIAIALLVIACQTSPFPPPTPTPTPAPTATPSPTPDLDLSIGLEADIQALDPAFAYDFTTNPVVNQVTEGLLRFEGGKRVVPHLAERVDHPDPLTYRYRIRQGITFHDGTPMTVEDVIFSMERIRNPQTASYVGWMYASVDRIEQEGDRTVKVTLKQPDAFWQYALATTAGHVISKAYYEAHGATFGRSAGGLMGTGAFQVDHWTPGKEVVLKRYGAYWDPAHRPSNLETVTFKVLPNGLDRVNALQRGEVELLIGTGIPVNQLPAIARFNQVNLTLTDSFETDFIAFNTQRSPFNNLKLRQALNYALDKDQSSRILMGDGATVAKATPVSPQLWTVEPNRWQTAYPKLPSYDQNLEKAAQLLNASGVADQANGKTILVDGDPIRIAQAQALQTAARALGITLYIAQVSSQELVSRSFGGDRNYDLLVTNWGSNFPDPAGNLLPVFHSRYTAEGGSNFGNYKNPDLDRLLDQQNTTTDPGKRAELLIKAQQMIAEQSIWIMLDHPKYAMALNNQYQGYTLTPLWYWDGFVKAIVDLP